ncbi:ABC transporter, partial [Colletotrichum asianum]
MMGQLFVFQEEKHGSFDFTLQFERSVLAIIPSSMVLLLSLVRLQMLHAKPRIIQGSILKYLKLSTIAIYGCLQLASLVIWI